MSIWQDHEQELLVDIEQCERHVWEALQQGNQDADKAALHPDFLGAYPDGFAGKPDHVGQLAHGPTVKEYTLSEVKVLPMGPDHAVLSYCADFIRTDQTEPEKMYVSSIWQRDSKGWVNIFSQDTPAIA